MPKTQGAAGSGRGGRGRGGGRGAQSSKDFKAYLKFQKKKDKKKSDRKDKRRRSEEISRMAQGMAAGLVAGEDDLSKSAQKAKIRRISKAASNFSKSGSKKKKKKKSTFDSSSDSSASTSSSDSSASSSSSSSDSDSDDDGKSKKHKRRKQAKHDARKQSKTLARAMRRSLSGLPQMVQLAVSSTVAAQLSPTQTGAAAPPLGAAAGTGPMGTLPAYHQPPPGMSFMSPDGLPRYSDHQKNSLMGLYKKLTGQIVVITGTVSLDNATMDRVKAECRTLQRQRARAATLEGAELASGLAASSLDDSAAEALGLQAPSKPPAAENSKPPPGSALASVSGTASGGADAGAQAAASEAVPAAAGKAAAPANAKPQRASGGRGRGKARTAKKTATAKGTRPSPSCGLASPDPALRAGALGQGTAAGSQSFRTRLDDWLALDPFLRGIRARPPPEFENLPSLRPCPQASPSGSSDGDDPFSLAGPAHGGRGRRR